MPEPGYLARLMQKMQELAESPMPDYAIVEYDPVIDSADMTPAHWRQIAHDISSNYRDFDGFVVLHGTDTMAYTASALAFMLPDLAKPVILTGSQLPLGQVRNDARENLKTAMMFAADYPVPEVAVFFAARPRRVPAASMRLTHQITRRWRWPRRALSYTRIAFAGRKYRPANRCESLHFRRLSWQRFGFFQA
jgi:L-asparaginase/Glu-tRNA(Gln) amidotransferase subunit D